MLTELTGILTTLHYLHKSAGTASLILFLAERCGVWMMPHELRPPVYRAILSIMVGLISEREF